MKSSRHHPHRLTPTLATLYKRNHPDEHTCNLDSHTSDTHTNETGRTSRPPQHSLTSIRATPDARTTTNAHVILTSPHCGNIVTQHCVNIASQHCTNIATQHCTNMATQHCVKHGGVSIRRGFGGGTPPTRGANNNYVGVLLNTALT